MDQRFDDLFENAMNASDRGKFLKFPRYQKNLKYDFDGLYSYNIRIAHLDTPRKTNQDRSVVSDLNHPLQLCPSLPGRHLWLQRINVLLMYIWK